MQVVQFPLHRRVALVLLPVCLQLYASSVIGVALDIPAPDEVHLLCDTLPCQHAAIALGFALHVSVS